MPSQTYIVSTGDSMPSIAKQKGFFWKTLWNHGDNADLKAKRKNPNVLYNGDKVVIPELQKKKESRGADAKHKFVRKGEPCKIAIQLMKVDGTPRANEPYELVIDKKTTVKGSTDGDGVLKTTVPNDAREGLLKLEDGKVTMLIKIGGLDPIDTVIGVQQRLRNRGYDCPSSNKVDDATARALTNYQSDNNLETTGKIDDATKAKLEEDNQ